MENKFNSDSTLNALNMPNEIVLKIDAWIRQDKGQNGQKFTPPTCRPSNYLLGT